MPPAPVPSEIEPFLKKPRAAVVATITLGGSPVTTATWYEWSDGHLLLSMDADGRRIRNVRNDPRVALTVFGNDMYTHVSLLGKVVEIRDDPGFVDVDRLSMAYEGKPYEERDWHAVTVIAAVERWHSYGDPAL